MDRLRWQKIETLYNSALEKPPADRERFLTEQCGDDAELRDEVSSLLASNEQTEGFLAEPEYELGLKILANPEPVLQPEQILGNYKILSLLGRGGMGEVYLSQDLRLGRLVALKVLPTGVAADSERIRRFMQEARAASALNHPNILTIYEIGESENLSFIVSEFVEGESLRRKLKRESGILLPELKEIALQIAAALNAAHKVGIIHRDVKPENVMLREDGLVKVLDFGLAKLTEDLDENLSANDLLTTQPGVIMGTASYMSPEQVRGQSVDARSDVWSFGVILYEMLTGKLPFEGETTSDIIAAILTTGLFPPEENLHESEEAVWQIIRRALRKNPSERYQTMVEVADDLRKLHLDPERPAGQTRQAFLKRKFTTTQKKVPTSENVPPLPTGDNFLKTGGRKSIVAIAVFSIIALGGIYAIYYFSNNLRWFSRGPLKITRISDAGKTVTAAISPDGKYVAHAVASDGKESIWIKHLATNSNVQLVEPKDIDYPAITFSRDGSYIYYVQNNGELYQIPVLGGESRKILDRVNSGISFSPDGRRFAFVRKLPADVTALMTANAGGGGERQLLTRRKPEFLVGPAWSPDGRVIACSAGNTSSAPLAGIFEIPADGGSERLISSQKWRAVWQPAWLSDGSGLIAPAISESLNNDSLQIWFFPASGGEVLQITNDTNNYGDVSLTADSSALVTIRFEQRNNIWYLPQGKTDEMRLVSNNVHAFYRFIAAMPDGRILYTSQEDSNSGRSIWVLNADGTNAKQLTAGPGDNILPCATGDGRYIVFASNRADLKTYHLWRMNADGTGLIQLTNGSGERGPVCSADGQTILYSSGGPDAGPEKSRLWKISTGGGEPVQLTDYPTGWKDISPDGKFIALRFKPDNASSLKLGIIASTGGQPIKVFDIKGNSQVKWTPDGRAVSYIKSENGISNIWIQPLSGEPPRQLTKFTAEEVLFFDWTKDGHLICTRGYQARDPVLFTNFK